MESKLKAVSDAINARIIRGDSRGAQLLTRFWLTKFRESPLVNLPTPMEFFDALYGHHIPTR